MNAVAMAQQFQAQPVRAAALRAIDLLPFFDAGSL